ncbi:vWA domain-containing protein [Candidatus Foliamicus sp.]
MLGKRAKREEQGLNLSFLDVVCCGFGAVILLLVITKIQEPVIIERSRDELEGLILLLERELFEIRGETAVLKRDLEPLRADTSESVRRVELTRREVDEAEERYFAARDAAQEGSDEAGNLLAARQSLTEEMERLLADYRPPPNDTTVGGIPVDSEYIIFAIDTSGSMQQNAWPAVQRVVSETLRVYPTVKGIQVINDEGQYLFSSFARRWIPDTATRRQSIVRAIANWQAYSDSNPAEGIVEAISAFYDPSIKVSIYVLGDDFSQGSAEALVRYVARINETDRFGNCLVRIHAVGFPVQLYGGAVGQFNRFANLMRVLSQRNCGTFVALPSLT